MINDMDVNYEDYHKLTHQQQRFCDEYLVHFNAFKAAINAGYSNNTARRGDLVHLPKIQVYLRGAMNRTQQRLQITQDMVLHELAKVAFSNMANYYDEYDALKPLNQLTNDQKAAISHYEILDSRDEDGCRAGKFGRIKLHNKMAALDKIARHIGFYDSKLEAVKESQESRIRNQDGEKSGSGTGSWEAGVSPEPGSYRNRKTESREEQEAGSLKAEAFEETQEATVMKAAKVADAFDVASASVSVGQDVVGDVVADENELSEHYFADGVVAAEIDDPEGGPALGWVRDCLPSVDVWGGESELDAMVKCLNDEAWEIGSGGKPEGLSGQGFRLKVAG